MKISLALRPVRRLSRAEAWGCFTANLALPGSGSLVAGRAVGYYQMGVYMIGFLMSIVGAIGFFRWYFSGQGPNSGAPDSDPFATFGSLLRAVEWPALGIGIVGFSIAWATVTSLQIMKANPKETDAPPVIR